MWVRKKQPSLTTLRMNGWSRYSMFGCSIRDHTLIDVVPITCENKNCLVWKNQPLSLSLPSCSCRSLSLWSRRCKGWAINMNCLFPFYVKYFTFWWEGRSLAQWLGRLWNTLWRFFSSLCRWTTEEEGIRKQKYKRTLATQIFVFVFATSIIGLAL